MKIRITKYGFLFTAAILLFGNACFGELTKLNDANLEDIYAASGFSLGIKNVQIFQFVDSFTYCASDNGYLTLNQIQFTDGQGGDVMRYNFDYTGLRMIDANGNILLESVDDTGATGYDGRLSSSGIINFNVAALEVASLEDWDLNTDPDAISKAMGIINVPNWDQEIGLNIAEFIFSDGTAANTYDLGSIDIGRIDLPSYDYYFAPHENGTGVDFEYDFEQHIDHIAYFYGNDCAQEYLAIRDIHIGESFGYGLPGDDPSDPSTWTTDIGKFKIGDMFGNLTPGSEEHARPAQIDAGTIDINGEQYGSLGLALPMSGSIRFEKAEFGGVDFGPGAIDGIRAYRMNIYMVP